MLVNDGSELGYLVGFATGANEIGRTHCGGTFGEHCPELQTNPGLQQPLLALHG